MNIVIIVLLIWIIAFLHFVWLDINPREWHEWKGRKDGSTVPEVQRTPAEDYGFMGKSLVKVSVPKPLTAISPPPATIPEEGEDMDEKDVAFELQKQEKTLRQMTPEEEKVAFKSFSYSKEEQDDEDEYPAEGYAEGLTSEEMERAVSVANGTKATRKEEREAGLVLREMDGTELFDLLTRNNPAFKTRVRNLLDRCERMETETGTESTSTTDKGRKSFRTEKTTDIDIRDFI